MDLRYARGLDREAVAMAGITRSSLYRHLGLRPSEPVTATGTPGAPSRGWSRAVLETMIASRLHVRQGASPSNFPTTLDGDDSDLAQEFTRDPSRYELPEAPLRGQLSGRVQHCGPGEGKDAALFRVAATALLRRLAWISSFPTCRIGRTSKPATTYPETTGGSSAR